MKIEVAEHARMSERGSSLLRLIQNNNMPILDLLVRESVQNSMDAGLEGSGYVDVGFSIKNFNSFALNNHLEGIRDNLRSKFPNEEYKLLEIRDSNTTGLTGPLHYNDVYDDNFGNLLKLIYEISMPQQKKGSGGSWGLGKTVYFRIGIGLVFYYTRIIDESGEYSSRLAACLVEDEQKNDALINSYNGKPKRGIAWWGAAEDEKTTKPLTDESEIRSILKIFNTRPYTDEETGTCIIIPYINEETLLDGVLRTENMEDGNTVPSPWWTSKVEDYLKVAIQKWYAPRLNNPDYSYGKWLRVSVNDEGINSENMLPLFKIAQTLYNQTPLSNAKKEKNFNINGAEIITDRISLRNVFVKDTCAGYVSYVKLTKEQLMMTYPANNPSPFVQINNYESNSELNAPILLYVRKPGMIVGYESTGEWVDGIAKTNPGEYIIGIFVLNSIQELKNSGEDITLEEYIRKSEKADHTSWADWAIDLYKPFIVAKIQRQVRNSISKRYTPITSEPYVKKNIGLGKALAEILLPPENFGFAPSLPPEGNSGGGNSGNSKSYGLKIIDNPKFNNGNVEIDFELRTGKIGNSFELQLQVLSETGVIAAENWENDGVIGKEFPIEFEELIIISSKSGSQRKVTSFDLSINKSTVKANRENIEIGILKTKRFQVPYGVKLNLSEGIGYTFYGTATFKSKDEKIKGGLTLNKKEG